MNASQFLLNSSIIKYGNGYVDIMSDHEVYLSTEQVMDMYAESRLRAQKQDALNMLKSMLKEEEHPKMDKKLDINRISFLKHIITKLS